MSDFIASLDPPLGIPKPNVLALVSFDLPIAKGDKIHCLDVLHSLTKYTLGFVDDGSEDFGKVSWHFFSFLKSNSNIQYRMSLKRRAFVLYFGSVFLSVLVVLTVI